MFTTTFLIAMATGAVVNAAVNSACRAKKTREAKRAIVASAGMARHIAAAIDGATPVTPEIVKNGDDEAPPAAGSEGPANPQ